MAPETTSALIRPRWRAGKLIAPAENRSADPHMGRTMGDGNLEIAGHAHRQHPQPMPGSAGREPGEMRRRIAIGRRNAHQPDKPAVEPGLTGGNEGIGVSGRDAGLLRFIPDIDLDQQVGRPAFTLDGVGNRVGEFWPVQHINHIGNANRVTRLVGLQPADDVQPHARMGCAQGGEFGRGFLHPVFPEHGLPDGEGGDHRLDRMGFGHCHQRYRMRRTACGTAGSVYPVAHRAQARGNMAIVNRGNSKVGHGR